MNRTARKIATSAAASAVALALTAPAAVADDRERHEGDRNAHSASQQRGDDGRAAARGHNGHGDGDERHDGRHQKWGGQGSEAPDGDADDSTEESGTEDSQTQESETDGSEVEDTQVQGAAADEDGVDERRQWSRGYRGHGEGDERHDGRHEKWGGQGADDGDEVESPDDGDEVESPDDSDESESPDDSDESETDDGSTDGSTDEGAVEDGTSDGFAEDQARMLDRLTEAQAFLTDLRERVEQAEMEPTLQETLLDLVDTRLATVSALIAQVESATSYDDLRPSETDMPGDGTTTAEETGEEAGEATTD